MPFKIKTSTVLYLLIPLLSLAMHFHVFKLDLIGYHTWRQTQTQSTINNFYREDFNILNPRTDNRENGSGIFRMEFPLMQWAFACFYKVFGNHLFISRILSFIIGLFSVFGMFRLLNIIFNDQKIALMGAWAFNFSPLFYYYTLNPLPDTSSLCCTIWGILFFMQYRKSNSWKDLIFSAILLSIATLCKLPFILYFSAIFIYLLYTLYRDKDVKYFFKTGFTYLLFLSPALVWYLKVIPTWKGNGVAKGIFDNTIGIGQSLDILWFNFISTLPELLINYAALPFFLCGVYFMFKNKAYKKNGFYLYLTWSISILMYFLYELNMIGTVHDYYLFPFLVLIFLIITYGIKQMMQMNGPRVRAFAWVVLFILPVTAFIRADSRWNTERPGFNRDLLVYKNELRAAVPANALCVVGNDASPFIYLYYTDKKGWVFDKDELTEFSLRDMISKGAQYLYCDSRTVDQNPEIKKHLDKFITQQGTVQVYHLTN